MEKKGFFDIQFNWIYILVAGIIILALFFSLRQSIITGADQDLNMDTAQYINNILISSGLNPNTEHEINLPEKHDLSFSCNYLQINGVRSPATLENIPVFAPDIAKANVQIASAYWNYPFLSGVFLYATSGEIVYVLVGAYDDLISLNNTLPRQTRKLTVQNYDEFENTMNAYKVRYITYGALPSGLEQSKLGKISDKDVSIIKITPASMMQPLGNSGKVEFFIKDGSSFINKGESYYLGSASLAGALFSEDKENFECNMKKALLRYGHTTKILQKKAEALSQERNLSHCPYDSPINLLGEVSIVASQGIINQASAETISGYYEKLAKGNKLLKTLSCPLLY